MTSHLSYAEWVDAVADGYYDSARNNAADTEVDENVLYDVFHTAWFLDTIGYDIHEVLTALDISTRDAGPLVKGLALAYAAYTQTDTATAIVANYAKMFHLRRISGRALSLQQLTRMQLHGLPASLVARVREQLRASPSMLADLLVTPSVVVTLISESWPPYYNTIPHGVDPEQAYRDVIAAARRMAAWK